MINLDIDYIRDYFSRFNVGRFTSLDNIYFKREVSVDKNKLSGFPQINLLEIDKETDIKLGLGVYDSLNYVRTKNLTLRNYNTDHFCSYICFGPFLYRNSGHERNIFMGIRYKLPRSRESANFTPLDKRSLEEYMNYCKDITGLHFYSEIVETNYYYIVLIDFCNLNRLQVKFVLFWLRMITEFPSNLAMIDAMLLQNIYPDEELYNLLIVPVTYQRGFVDIRSIYRDQSLVVPGSRFIDKDELIGRLNSPTRGSVIRLFSSNDRQFNIASLPKESQSMLDVNKNYFNSNKWYSPESLEARFKSYEEIYKILNNSRIKKKE